MMILLSAHVRGYMNCHDSTSSKSNIHLIKLLGIQIALDAEVNHGILCSCLHLNRLTSPLCRRPTIKRCYA